MDNRSSNDKNKAIITDIGDEETTIEEETNSPAKSHEIESELTPEEQQALDVQQNENAEEIDTATTEAPEEKETPQAKQKIVDPKQTQSPDAQILSEKTKQMTNAATNAAAITQPTDQELREYVRADGIDVDDLTIGEKLAMKKAYMAEKRSALFQNAAIETSKIDEWSKKVTSFLDENTVNQTNKQLIGREEEFRNFALQEKHRGVDISVLIGSFLYSSPKQKRSNVTFFATNGGGLPTETKRSDVITDPKQAAIMRRTNQKEYMRMIKEGKIKLQV